MKKYIEYFPEFLRDIDEFKAIGGCEDKILTDMKSFFDDVEKSQWISTSLEKGLERREKMLGIGTSQNKTYEERRKNIIAKWNNFSPYTYYSIKNWLESICGKDNFSLSIEYGKYKVVIEIKFSIKGLMDIIYNEARRMIPSNMELEVNVIYTRHNEIKATHKELSVYRHISIREESLIFN